MIQMTVTTVPHLLADDQTVQLGLSIQAAVAAALDVPGDEQARVRREDVSVEFRSFVYGINLRAVSIVVLAPDHPERRANLAERLRAMAAELNACKHMPSRAITDRKGGVSVQVILGPSAAMHL